MIFETYFKHVYLYVACLYATSGTGLYAQTLHQHAGTQRDTVPVTFPVQHLEEVVITAGRPGITAGAVRQFACHIAGTDQWCQFSQHRNNSIQTRHSWNAWQPHPDHQ